MVTFSIIMPAYNSEKTIDNAIKSVIFQDNTDWELIIVNDGSTDNTHKIITSYANNDIRVKVYTKENGGYVSAVNYGLERVTGKYFLMMGSDDTLNTKLFSTISNYLQQYGFVDLIGFRTVVIDSNNNENDDITSSFDMFSFEISTSINEYSLRHKKQSMIFFTRDTSKIYKTELLHDLRYYGCFGMDADGIFSMLFANKSSSFMSIPFRGYYWYQHDDSLSGKKKTYYVQKDRIYNWVHFFQEIYANNDICEEEKNYLLFFYNTLKYTYLANKLRFIKDHINDVAYNIIKAFFKKYKPFCFHIPVEMRVYLFSPFLWYFVSPVLVFMERKAKKMLRLIFAK